MSLITFNSDIHHRQSIRLKEYDYSKTGAYFITICTQNREMLFGEIVNNEMCLNDFGKMIEAVWSSLPKRYPEIELDVFIVMPNHLHGVIYIQEIVGAGLVPALNDSGQPEGLLLHEIGEIIGGFKSITTVHYIKNVKDIGWPPFQTRLWQRNYYESIIRDEFELKDVREYIRNNPLRWEEDKDNVENINL